MENGYQNAKRLNLKRLIKRQQNAKRLNFKTPTPKRWHEERFSLL